MTVVGLLLLPWSFLPGGQTSTLVKRLSIQIWQWVRKRVPKTPIGIPEKLLPETCVRLPVYCLTQSPRVGNAQRLSQIFQQSSSKAATEANKIQTLRPSGSV